MQFTFHFIYVKINVIPVFSFPCLFQPSVFAWFLDNIALHKSAWQLHPYEKLYFKDYLNASKAVDGLRSNLSYFAFQCTQSGSGQDVALWRVDLGSVLGIHHITLYYRTDSVLWGKYCRCFYLIPLFQCNISSSLTHKNTLGVLNCFIYQFHTFINHLLLSAFIHTCLFYFAKDLSPR